MLDVLRTTERPEALEAGWRPAVRRRVAFVLAGIALWGLVIEARLIWLQLVQHKAYVAQALIQQEAQRDQPAVRGDIQDRRGRVLAMSADADQLVADAKQVKDPVGTAAALCRALGDCTAQEQASFIAKLSKDARWVRLRRWQKLSPRQADDVAALELDGISLYTDFGRYYPDMSLAAHLLGFVDVDSKGLGGIEQVYDDRLRGRPGRAQVQIASKHRIEERIEEPPVPGDTLELTMDRDLQYIAERELDAGIKENNAVGGTVVIVDPGTGAILALANLPTFNPNVVSQSSEDNRTNRATQDVYEPGSTFKIVTVSAALDDGVLKPTDLIDTNPGVITFPGRKPITEDAGRNYGVLSLEDVVVKSSNIGAIRTGLRVGADRLCRYERRFGFGEGLGSDFVGESWGRVVSSSNMNDSTLASTSMGYNVSVTPVQMAMAASVIANGGTLFEPHLVSAFIHNGQREPVEPKPLGRAISSETAATMTTIMEEVVRRGTATKAQLDRYQVAGKTGTARKIVNRLYSDTDYMASFVGFVPSRRPAFTILVVIDTPRAGHTHGGDVAAPIFKRIAEAALLLEGVPPTINPTPPIVISAQAAPVAPPAPRSPEVILTTTPVGARPVMPDVQGLAARDAVRILGSVGLTVRLSGSGFGFVVSQKPAAGQAVDPGEVSVIELRRMGAPVPRAPGGRE